MCLERSTANKLMKKYIISQSETIIKHCISLEETQKQQTVHYIGSDSDRKKQDNLMSHEPDYSISQQG